MKAELVVVGAGPAGLAAACEAQKRDVDVVVLDESMAPGGRLLCQVHEDPYKSNGQKWWIGPDIAASLVDDARKAGVERIISGAEVWGIFPEPRWRVMVGGESPVAVDAKAVLIATGAGEQPTPVDGWTLPGVLTVGAAQVMINQWRVKPGSRGLVVGLDPLAFTATHSLVMAGVDVVGLVNPPPGPLSGNRAVPVEVLQNLGNMAHLAPSAFLRSFGRLARYSTISRVAAGLYSWPIVRVWDVPVMARHAIVKIEGDSAVTGAVVAAQDTSGQIIPGSEKEIELDFVCLSGGLYPLAELAAAVGCEFCYLPELGGHVPVHGSYGQTTVDRIFVAGNATGIESAPVAIEQGRLSGQAIALALRGCSDEEIYDSTTAARENIAQGRAEAPLEFLPQLGKGREMMAELWSQAHRARDVEEVVT